MDMVLDIETIPFKFDEYKSMNPATKKKAGLHDLISQVVCAGVMVDGKKKIFIDKSEQVVLTKLYDCFDIGLNLTKNYASTCIIGYNTIDFDFSMLKVMWSTVQAQV